MSEREQPKDMKRRRPLIAIEVPDRTYAIVFVIAFVYSVSVHLLMRFFSLPAPVSGAMWLGTVLFLVALAVLTIRGSRTSDVASPQDALGYDEPTTPHDDLAPQDDLT